MKRAVETYRLASPVIRDGFTRFIGKRPPQRSLEGMRGAVRVAKDGRKALVVAHVFDDDTPSLKITDARLKSMRVQSIFASDGVSVYLSEGVMEITGLRAMTAFAVVAKI